MTINKKDIEKLVRLYERERQNFHWLISFEEFVNDYVVECENCHEYFVTDNNEKLCEKCLMEIDLDKLDSGVVDINWNKDKYYEGR